MMPPEFCEEKKNVNTKERKANEKKEEVPQVKESVVEEKKVSAQEKKAVQNTPAKTFDEKESVTKGKEPGGFVQSSLFDIIQSNVNAEKKDNTPVKVVNIEDVGTKKRKARRKPRSNEDTDMSAIFGAV